MTDQIVNQIIAWENGELDDDETVKFFQEIINQRVIEHLQGCYGRQAVALIEANLCVDTNGYFTGNIEGE